MKKPVSFYSEGFRLVGDVYLPDGMRIRAAGEVVRVVTQGAGSDDNLYGIKFTDISDEHRAALAIFIEREYQYHLSLVEQEPVNAA